MFLSLDTVFYYHAFWAVSKLKLKCQWTEHIAVGLLGVLMDVPYDITGVRFINWTWHDTDPNIFERTYFVPWTSYFFHFTFACSMSFIMHNARMLFQKKNQQADKWQRGSLIAEVFSVYLTSTFSMPCGALMFMVSYHILHDFLLVPTEAVILPIFAVLLLVVWSADRRNNQRNNEEEEKGKKKTIADQLMCLYLPIHYLTFVVINSTLNPEQHISTSLHEPIGDCESTKIVKTILKDLKKRAFLCLEDYDEKYYDFKCLKEVPPTGSSWYTVCGTPYE